MYSVNTKSFNVLPHRNNWKYALLEVKEDYNRDDKSCQRDGVASLVDEIYLSSQLKNTRKSTSVI